MGAKKVADEKREEVVAEEAETEDSAELLPLALGINGDPIDVPEEAEGWRVSWRKLGERGGSPSLIYANGRPLVLALDATADDLIEQVGGKPGRFRLEPVDESGRVIRDATPAYSVIEKQIQLQAVPAPPATEAGASSLEGLVHELVQSNRAAIKTLQDCFTVQSQQVASVLTACSNMVNPNRPVQQLITVEKEGSNPGFDWATFMATVTPAVQTLMGVVMQKFASAPTPIAPSVTR